MRRLFLVQHGLVDFHSHYYGEARGWAAACQARGIAPLFYVNRRAQPRILSEFQAKPAFPYPPDAVLERDQTCAALTDYIFLAEVFARNLQALQADGVGGDDAVVVTYATERDLFGASLWLQHLQPEVRPTMFFIFHTPSFGWSIDDSRTALSGDYSWHRHAAKRLRAALPPEKLVLLATNPRLAKAISVATELDCGQVPLAMNYVSDPVLASGDERKMPHVHVRLAGEFREEKGGSVVIEVIKRFAEERPGRPFGVQVGSQKAAQHLAGQVADCPSPVYVHYGNAAHEDYQRRLVRSDLLLLPYRWQRYALRASGVFTEALGFGLVTVVPERTWMGDTLAQGWGAGVTFRTFSAASISKALVVASDALPQLRGSALASRDAWRREQSAETLLDRVLQRLPAA
jgi:glycosyltransferase involved in cell wall biosynthesis